MSHKTLDLQYRILLFLFFHFFQAEDGIRDAQESRGLGDVYKRQVLGPGWPAILIHEAIGHGLEGDFNRKKTSAFHNLMGEKVASEGVTIVDDLSLIHI